MSFVYHVLGVVKCDKFVDDLDDRNKLAKTIAQALNLNLDNPSSLSYGENGLMYSISGGYLAFAQDEDDKIVNFDINSGSAFDPELVISAMRDVFEVRSVHYFVFDRSNSIHQTLMVDRVV